jgi:hypothetical protein
MADKRRLARWILSQNYTHEYLATLPNMNVIKFDKDAWLYWINPLNELEIRDRLDREPIYVNESVLGTSQIGTATI